MIIYYHTACLESWSPITALYGFIRTAYLAKSNYKGRPQIKSCGTSSLTIALGFVKRWWRPLFARQMKCSLVSFWADLMDIQCSGRPAGRDATPKLGGYRNSFRKSDEFDRSVSNLDSVITAGISVGEWIAAFSHHVNHRDFTELSPSMSVQLQIPTVHYIIHSSSTLTRSYTHACTKPTNTEPW